MIFLILPAASSQLPPRVEGIKQIMGEADDFWALIAQEDKQVHYDAVLNWSSANLLSLILPITSTFSILVLCVQGNIYCLEDRSA